MRLLGLGGAAVIASLVAGCGSAPRQPSKRAQLAARRHVLVVPREGSVPDHTDDDGAIVLGGTFDLPTCAQVCGGVLAPGERVVGCFRTIADDDVARRMSNDNSIELLDCALW